MVKRFIYSENPTRKNFNSLKNNGYLQINGDRDLLNLKFKGLPLRVKSIHSKILLILKEEGFVPFKIHNINRCRNHKKSYLINSPFESNELYPQNNTQNTPEPCDLLKSSEDIKK